MRRLRDPASLTPLERLAELGELLARANQRARVRRNQLAGTAVGEPACLSVNGKDAEGKETA
jgi:hypothetical protein